MTRLRHLSRDELVALLVVIVVAFAIIVISLMAYSASGAMAHGGHDGKFTCTDRWHYGFGHDWLSAEFACRRSYGGHFWRWGGP